MEDASHVWQALLNNRAISGNGCPICKGKLAIPSTSLATTHPELASEWHPTLNNSLKPNQIRANSHKKIWWRCLQAAHEWQATAYSRVSGNNCPYCAGQKASAERNLAARHPELLTEWDYEKNVGLAPQNMLPATSKKVWWRCKRNPLHSWQASIASRTRIGTGCPFCNSQTSTYELRVYAEMLGIFPDAKTRHKIGKDEADIFLPSLGIALEIDGAFWHRNKTAADESKNQRLQAQGVRLRRLRQAPLAKISSLDIEFPHKGLELRNVKELVERIREIATPSLLVANRIGDYLATESWANDSEYQHLLERLPGPALGNSLADLYPDMAKEWHPYMNANLLPTDIAAQANMKIWWQCQVDPAHVWQTSPNSRVVNKSGYPYCAGRKASATRNLKTSHPEVAAEWHPTKNGELHPADVSPVSGRKVWWRCSRNPAHVWSALISNRVKQGQGCPFCKGKRPSLLSVEKILQWADEQYSQIGRWPTLRSGDVLSAPTEKWSAINSALVKGRRGLIGSTTLADLLGKERKVFRGPNARRRQTES